MCVVIVLTEHLFKTLDGLGKGGKLIPLVKCQSWHSAAIIQYLISRFENEVPHITGTVHISQQSPFLTNHTMKTKLDTSTSSLYQYYDHECNQKYILIP